MDRSVNAARRCVVKHRCSWCEHRPGVSPAATGGAGRGGDGAQRERVCCCLRAMHGRSRSRLGTWDEAGVKRGLVLLGVMHGGSFLPHTSCGSVPRPQHPNAPNEHTTADQRQHHCRPAHDNGPRQTRLLDSPPLFATHPLSLHTHLSRLIAPDRIRPPAMDDLREQVELLESSANLSTSISDVQRAIDQLVAARAKIAAGM